MNTEMVKLQSSDDQEFEVTKQVAEMSKTIKLMMEDLEDDMDLPIPLPNVAGKILAKVVEYCKHHTAETTKEATGTSSLDSDISEWDTDFCNVDQTTLFELILAANYLDIKPLLDLTCKIVANMIKGKTSEEIRKTFNIKNDFTPEEEEQIRRENEWCEEK